MGIEPTCDAVNTPHNGFEDRGHHQVCKHFRTRRVGTAHRNLVLYERGDRRPSGAGGKKS